MLNNRQTAVFCSQLKALLASGMPLLEALGIVRSLTQNKKCSAQLAGAIALINDGNPLSQAAGGLLPVMALGAIGAAERAGDLEECLGRLAVHYENKAELQEKLIGSLIYPVFVLILCLASLFLLVFFVLPGMKGLFSDLNTALPPLTSLVLNGSDGLARAWPLWLGSILTAVAWLVVLRQRQPIRLEQLLLKVPLLGGLYRQELTIQSFGTLGALLRGGTPILEALTITAGSVSSPYCRRVIGRSRERVEDGVRLSEAFRSSRFFPAEAIQMIGIGEGSGQLAEILVSSAGFQARQREAALKRLTTLLEPALTLTVGGAVALVVLALFLPLVNMISSLQ
ncbi:MAG: type II secretion system F family protein [Candidatus Margulisiibacteriota bacterium]